MNLSGKAIRKIIIEQAYRARVGHIGSALSIADLIAVLYGEVLRIPDPDAENRDRFVLSKGHAALALYAALHLKGWIDLEQLNSYCGDNTLLGVHPEHQLRGVDFATGSLGQGLSYATGAALAARFCKSSRRAYALLSDAELNEGAVWEAIIFAAHHKLANLIVLVDDNAQQALGYTRDVLNLSPLRKRWEAFDWDVHEVDGHNAAELTRILNSLDTTTGRPHVLLAKTTFGKGVSYMHGQIKWHYWPMSETEYRQALLELEAV